MGKIREDFSKIRSLMLHRQEATNKFRLIIRRLLRIRKLNHLKTLQQTTYRGRRYFNSSIARRAEMRWLAPRSLWLRNA